jgi:hypothetical protein
MAGIAETLPSAVRSMPATTPLTGRREVRVSKDFFRQRKVNAQTLPAGTSEAFV